MDERHPYQQEMRKMAEELQSLLDKIRREGVDKAAAERDAMIRAARTEAEAIKAAAREEAAKMRSDAESACAALEKRSAGAIRQAARDVLLDLKSELERRLTAIVRQRTGEALTADFMASIIRDVVQSSLKQGDGALEAMVPAAQCEELAAKLAASIGADFASHVQLFPGNGLAKGLKISMAGDQVFFDFSDAALTEMVAGYAGAKVGAILLGEND